MSTSLSDVFLKAIEGPSSSVVPHTVFIRSNDYWRPDQRKRVSHEEAVRKMAPTLTIRIQIPQLSIHGHGKYNPEHVRMFRAFVNELRNMFTDLKRNSRTPFANALRKRGIRQVRLELREYKGYGKKKEPIYMEHRL